MILTPTMPKFCGVGTVPEITSLKNSDLLYLTIAFAKENRKISLAVLRITALT